jgi:hypothetical protein
MKTRSLQNLAVAVVALLAFAWVANIPVVCHAMAICPGIRMVVDDAATPLAAVPTALVGRAIGSTGCYMPCEPSLDLALVVGIAVLVVGLVLVELLSLARRAERTTTGRASTDVSRANDGVGSTGGAGPAIAPGLVSSAEPSGGPLE